MYEIAWTANSDHILCATDGESRAGEMKIIAFKNHKLEFIGSMRGHSGYCEKLAIDNRYENQFVKYLISRTDTTKFFECLLLTTSFLYIHIYPSHHTFSLLGIVVVLLSITLNLPTHLSISPLPLTHLITLIIIIPAPI